MLMPYWRRPVPMEETMPEAVLTGIRGCVFDAYGTLFDFASAASGCGDALGGDAARLTQLWRDKQLQYAWLRSLQGRHADFWQVTCDALDYALAALGRSDAGLRERLMRLYLELRTFPDVADALRRVKAAGLTSAILSNGSPAMLGPVIANSGIGGLLDHVLSVEEAGIYKPHPSVYQLAVDRLGLAPAEILFLSSNGWDAYAAAAFGLRVAWCNRYGQPKERLPGAPDAEIATLAELPGLLGI